MLSKLIESFKKDLATESPDTIFEKYLIKKESYLFNEIMKNPFLENRIKKIVSQACGVNEDTVYLVGSSKLGFSLNPEGLYNPVDFKYQETGVNKDKSDLDVAIVSPELFYRVGREVHGMTNSYKAKWHTNEYYPNKGKLAICYSFFEYYTKGWFRPDFKPEGYDFCTNSTYQEIKREVYRLTSRKLTIAIYIDQFYFRTYHLDNLRKLSLALKTNKR